MLAGGCLQPNLEDPTAVITCASSHECPDGFFCNRDSGSCISPHGDLVPPFLITLRVDPEQPSRGEPVLIEMVASEPLRAARITLGPNSVASNDLSTDDEQGGLPGYAADLRAPNVSGPVQLTIEATDRAGNRNTISGGVVYIQ